MCLNCMGTESVHGSREPGYYKHGSVDSIPTYNYSLCMALAMINVGLAQAHPNNTHTILTCLSNAYFTIQCCDIINN